MFGLLSGALIVSLILCEVMARVFWPNWQEFLSTRFMRATFVPGYGILYTGWPGFDRLAAILPFYCYFPKCEWADLRRAERDDPEGNRVREHYAEIYRREFLGEDQDTKQRIRIEGATGCRTNPKDALFLSPKRLSEEEISLLSMPAG